MSLWADFFPKSSITTIIKATDNEIVLKSPLSHNGMSCAIIHNYGNNIKALTFMAKQISKDGSIKLIDSDIIHHNKIPTINTKPKVGDRIIGGYLYNNTLLLAPDEQTYKFLTEKYHKNWTHPDLYAMFLLQEGEDSITKKSLKLFAKRYQIGLIMIVRQKSIVLYDPISETIINTQNYTSNSTKAKYPFYMHFKQINSDWFSKKNRDYYKEVERF